MAAPAPGRLAPGKRGTGYVPITCTPGIPATTQLRRMQNWQYDASVRDLLGVTTVDLGAGAKAPSTQLYADFDGPMVPDAYRIYKDVGAAIAKAVMANATQKAKFITLRSGRGRYGRDDLPDQHDQDVRSQGVPPPADRRRGDALPGARHGNDPGAERPPSTPRRSCTRSSCRLRSSRCPRLSTTTPSGSGFQLSSYEVAQRLSYMLWGSIPDDMLSTAADDNRLQTKAQILTQANRMIGGARQDDAARDQLFHRQWVQMNNANAHWWNGDHDMTKFPLYNTTTVQDAATGRRSTTSSPRSCSRTAATRISS